MAAHTRNSTRSRLPVTLTIAGSDSGGGAGLQADLRTFTSLRVHGTTVVTCVTAQNPRGVSAIEAVSTALVKAQLDALFAELPPAAAKTGMLYSAATIRAVAERFCQPGSPPLVVDPVMVATSGARLLPPAAEQALRDHLLPIAAIITPNLDEAGALLETKIRSLDDLREAARELHRRFGVPVLAKGGHLRGSHALDILWDGHGEWLLSAPFIRGVTTHGTGCTYSAAIAAGLARGLKLPAAVAAAKRHVTRAIAGSRRIGRHQVLWGF